MQKREFFKSRYENDVIFHSTHLYYQEGGYQSSCEYNYVSLFTPHWYKLSNLILSHKRTCIFIVGLICLHDSLTSVEQ